MPGSYCCWAGGIGRDEVKSVIGHPRRNRRVNKSQRVARRRNR